MQSFSRASLGLSTTNFAAQEPTSGRGRLLASLIHFNRQPNYNLSPETTPENSLVDLPETLPPAPTLTEGEQLRRLNARQVLLDPMGRVSDEFEIPKALLPRVQFWFDIYTRYGSNTQVIHHDRFPWLVYEVVDFTDQVQNGKGPKWLRIQRGKQLVQRRRYEIRTALKKMAAHPKRRARTELERHLADVLKAVPGSRAKVYRQASESLRSQLGQRDFFIGGLRRSSRYLPYLEETFMHAELPLDLTRMPFVESSFNEQAESKVGASGIWQVMPATGRGYGLVTSQIDERNSPIKASAMAARLLRSYHRALGSWPLAVTAYNHGIGNIESAIRAARSRDLATIIERYHKGSFKFASSNFYTCFLAALFAERYSEIVFPSVARESALTHERLLITRNVKLSQLVKQGQLDLASVFEYNMDLKRDAWRTLVLPRGFELHLPPGQVDGLPERFRRNMQPAAEIPAWISQSRHHGRPSI